SSFTRAIARRRTSNALRQSTRGFSISCTPEARRFFSSSCVPAFTTLLQGTKRRLRASCSCAGIDASRRWLCGSSACIRMCRSCGCGTDCVAAVSSIARAKSRACRISISACARNRWARGVNAARSLVDRRSLTSEHVARAHAAHLSLGPTIAAQFETHALAADEPERAAAALGCRALRVKLIDRARAPQSGFGLNGCFPLRQRRCRLRTRLFIGLARVGFARARAQRRCNFGPALGRDGSHLDSPG